jgi:hypothetical protein
MPQVRQSPLTQSIQSTADKTDSDSDATLENFAATLVDAVYPVALRHEGGHSWVELELALWKVLNTAVHDWNQSARLCVARGD